MIIFIRKRKSLLLYLIDLPGVLLQLLTRDFAHGLYVGWSAVCDQERSQTLKKLQTSKGDYMYLIKPGFSSPFSKWVLLLKNNLLYGMQNHFYRIRTAWQLSLIPFVERLPDQAVILVNCVPFKMGTSLKGNNLPPRGNDFFSFKCSSLWY